MVLSPSIVPTLLLAAAACLARPAGAGELPPLPEQFVEVSLSVQGMT